MNKSLINICCSFLALSMCAQTSGQTDPTHIPKYLPPSPNVAALMKFVDVPVSNYTGTASISVPIFQVEAKGIKVPVSLDYHTGGIKVNEESGMVGLGWALTAGGSISRTVMDLDDFADSGYFNVNVPQPTGDMGGSKPFEPANTNMAMIATAGAGGPYIYDFGCNDQANIGGNLVDFSNLFLNAGAYDMEPDQFSFNFLGHTGKFIINRAKKVIQQEQSNLQFWFGTGTSPDIIATDDEGNRFFFQDKDCNTSASYGTCLTNTWNLTKVITQLNDTVTFTYSTAGAQISTLGDITQSMIYGSDNDGFKVTNASGVFYGNEILTTIDFRTGQIQLNYDNLRSDLKNGIKYNTFKIYSKIGSTLNYLKQFDLFYSYFTASSAPTDSFENKRLILDSVRASSGSTKIPAYSFKYNTPSPGTNGLAKHSFYIDDWGYFNGYANSVLIPSVSVFFASPDPTYPSNWIQYSGANRNTDANYASAFLLNTIYYPTGGKTMLEYEGNTYDKQKSTTGPTDFPKVTTEVYQQQIASGKRGDSTGTIDFTYIYPVVQAGGPSNMTMLLTFRCSDPTAANTLKNGTYGQVSFGFTGQNANSLVDIKDVTCSGSVCTATYTFTIPGGNQIYNWDCYINPSVGTLFQDIRVTFQYNRIKEVVDQIVNNNYIVKAGGLRVKSISDFSSEGKIAKKRVFQYDYLKDTNGDGILESYTYGRLMDFPSYIRYQPYYSVRTDPTSGVRVLGFFPFMSISGSTATSMTSQVHNNIVGYDRVIVRTIDPISNLDIGKTEYNYFNSADSSVSYAGGYGPLGINVMPNAFNGSLLSKIDSSVNNGTYTKISEIDNLIRSKTELSISPQRLCCPVRTFHPDIAREERVRLCNGLQYFILL